MNTLGTWGWRTAVLLCAGLTLGGCRNETDASPGKTVTDRKIRVVATTGMVADMAKIVGGDRVEVAVLMGPGVDPHLYKATAGDVERLSEADVIFYNGHLLEGKMQDILLKMARKRAVYAITEDIPSTEVLEPQELDGHADPHLWFDVRLWSKTTGVVARAYAALDPPRAQDYKARAKSYEAKLLELDKEVRNLFNLIPKERRVLITSHDAFRYLGRAYGIEVTGIQGISTVDEAGIADRKRIERLVIDRGVKAIFVETSVSHKMIEAVVETVRKSGHEVRVGGELFSDALGDHDPVNTYVGMVRHNAQTIVEALK